MLRYVDIKNKGIGTFCCDFDTYLSSTDSRIQRYLLGQMRGQGGQQIGQ